MIQKSLRKCWEESQKLPWFYLWLVTNQVHQWRTLRKVPHSVDTSANLEGKGWNSLIFRVFFSQRDCFFQFPQGNSSLLINNNDDGLTKPSRKIPSGSLVPYSASGFLSSLRPFCLNFAFNWQILYPLSVPFSAGSEGSWKQVRVQSTQNSLVAIHVKEALRVTGPSSQEHVQT